MEASVTLNSAGTDSVEGVPLETASDCASHRTRVGVALIALLFVCLSAIVILGVLQSVSEPTLNYGVVLDLGSSGSRVYIYQWNNSEDGSGYELDSIQPTPEGGPFWGKKVNPGVSSYDDDPQEAAHSLEPLLDYAVAQLKLHHIDPSEVQLVCYATAGMRMLSKDVSAQITTAIREFIVNSYPFRTSDDAIRVISGQEEALFDYIAVQQLLTVFDNGRRDRKHIGALDLGGSSVELAFQLDEHDLNAGPITRISEPAYVTPTVFNDKIIDIYGVAYTGLGHNAAFSAILELAVSQLENDGGLSVDGRYTHPCLHNGNAYTHNGDDDDDNDDVQFIGTGDWAACVEMTRLLMNRTAMCESNQCAFNGVYQPPVEGFFIAMDNFAATVDFYELGNQPVLRDFIPATKEFCGVEWDAVANGHYSKKAHKLRELCFEGIYVHELLTYGFGFSESSSQILFTDTIFGVPANWGLGAMRLTLQSLVATRSL